MLYFGSDYVNKISHIYGLDWYNEIRVKERGALRLFQNIMMSTRSKKTYHLLAPIIINGLQSIVW